MQTEMDFFKISNVKVSRSMIALNDTFTLSYTLKNNGSFDAYEVIAGIMIDERDFVGATAGTTYYDYADRLTGTVSVNIARGASRNFSHTYTPSDKFKEKYMSWLTKHPETRAIPLTLMISYRNKSGSVDDWDLYNFATLLDMHYDLKIDEFALERATGGAKDDEGESVLADIKVYAAPAASAFLHDRTTLRVYYARGTQATEASDYIDLTNGLPLYLQGASDSDVIANTFDKGSDWSFLIVFTDGYEPARAYYNLSKSFANVHLSGKSTGGVAFGKFSSAEEDSPLFECEYPAEFNGGIKGVTNYASGEVPTGGRWIDGKPIYRQIIPFSITSANVDKATQVGTIADMEMPISMQGFAYRGAANTKYMPLNFWYTDSNYCSTHLSDAGAIIMKLSHASTGYVIVEYTKKT